MPRAIEQRTIVPGKLEIVEHLFSEPSINHLLSAICAKANEYQRAGCEMHFGYKDVTVFVGKPNEWQTETFSARIKACISKKEG